jgi:hypothetical protein
MSGPGTSPRSIARISATSAKPGKVPTSRIVVKPASRVRAANFTPRIAQSAAVSMTGAVTQSSPVK